MRTLKTVQQTLVTNAGSLVEKKKKNVRSKGKRN